LFFVASISKRAGDRRSRLVNQEEHIVDVQEMSVWSILNWRFLRFEQIGEKYGQMAGDLPPARRMLVTCLNRLEVRGLVARGVGGTRQWINAALAAGFALMAMMERKVFPAPCRIIFLPDPSVSHC